MTNINLSQSSTYPPCLDTADHGFLRRVSGRLREGHSSLLPPFFSLSRHSTYVCKIV